MGSAAERIIDLYERHAGAWDSQRSGTRLEASWIERFVARLPPGAAILDIGCGAGAPIATHLDGLGFSITGVDSSPAMIARARERMPRQTWHVADMRELSLGRRFDGMLAWDSFFHLTREDQRAMFRVFGAHAGPRCALMFTSGPSDGEAIGALEGEPLYHASLDPDVYRALLRDEDFEVLDFIANDPDCGGHTVWLARRI